MGMTIEAIIQGLKETYMICCSAFAYDRKKYIDGAIDRLHKYQQLVNDNEQLRAYITMMQADYKARLKADMAAMLEDLRFQAEENIENIYEKDEDNILMLAQHNAFADCFAQYNSLIEERIDALKGEEK